MAYPVNQQVGSGQFTNLKQYIDANKPKANQIAGAITGQFGQEAQKVKSGLQSQQSQFEQEATQKAGALEESRKFSEGLLQKASEQGQQATADETSRFKNILSGNERYDNLQQKDLTAQEMQAGQLENKAKQAQLSSGRNQMLQDVFGKRQYTKGQQAIDSFLLGTDKGARESIAKTAKAGVSDIAGQIKSVKDTQAQRISELQNKQQNLMQGLGAGIDTGFSKVKSEVQSRANQYNTELQNAANALRSGLSKGMSMEQAANDQLYGNKSSLGDFFTLDPSKFQGISQEGLAILKDVEQRGLGSGETDPNRFKEYNDYLATKGGDYLNQRVSVPTSKMDINQLINPKLLGDEMEQGKASTAEQRARQKALEQLSGRYSTYLDPNQQMVQLGDYDKQLGLQDLEKQRQENLKQFDNIKSFVSRGAPTTEVKKQLEYDNWKQDDMNRRQTERDSITQYLSGDTLNEFLGQAMKARQDGNLDSIKQSKFGPALEKYLNTYGEDLYNVQKPRID